MTCDVVWADGPARDLPGAVRGGLWLGACLGLPALGLR